MQDRGVGKARPGEPMDSARPDEPDDGEAVWRCQICPRATLGEGTGRRSAAELCRGSVAELSRELGGEGAGRSSVGSTAAEFGGEEAGWRSRGELGEEGVGRSSAAELCFAFAVGVQQFLVLCFFAARDPNGQIGPVFGSP